MTTTSSSAFLQYVPPMGIYETLYAFLDSFGTYMGEPGTHPWSQGFPRTVQLPDGPMGQDAFDETTGRALETPYKGAARWRGGAGSETR